MNFPRFILKLKANKKFLLFCLVGSLGTLSNLVVFFITRKFFHVNVNVAAVLAFAYAVTQNYYLNNKWTFRHVSSGSLGLKSYLKYVGVNLFGLSVNLLVLNLALHLGGPGFPDILAQIIAVCFSFAVNYAGASLLVFAEKERVFQLKEWQRWLLIFLVVFGVSFMGQVIAVIGNKTILKPFLIEAINKQNQQPKSFEQFMQLARAGNFTLIKPSPGQPVQGLVENVFLKKLVVGLSQADLRDLQEIKVTIGEKKFSYFPSDFFAKWEQVDPKILSGNLSGVEDSSYKFFEAPLEVRYSFSQIPVYKSFFQSVINWGGDDLLLKQPAIKSFIFSIFALAVLALCRYIFSPKKQFVSEFSESEILDRKKRYLIFSLSFYSASVLLLLVCGALAVLYKPNTAQVLAEAQATYVPYIFKSIRPKSLERLQFLLSTFLAPFALFFCYRFWYRISEKVFTKLEKWNRALVWLNGLVFFALIYIALAISGFFFVRDSIFSVDYIKYIYGLIVFPGLVYLLVKNKLPKQSSLLVYILAAWGIITAFCLGVINLKNGYVPVDLDPVIYPQVLVQAGHYLLAPITSFYGLYPFFLKPIFYLIGFSVLKFSLVMSALMVLGYLLFYKSLSFVIKDKLFKALAFLALIFYTVLATRNMPEYYFQYWPIRFLFPAVCFYFVLAYFKRKTRGLYWLSLFAAAASMLWNLDVGAVLFLTVILTLVFAEFEQFKNWKNILTSSVKHIGFAVLVLGLTFGLFSLITFVQSGLWPDFSLLTRYQKLFLSGLLNIPLVPPPHLWSLIILIYLAALLVSARAFYKKIVSYQIIIIFYLALLGFGLFAYYEGQSSDITLFRTSYPAIILCAMFTEYLWQEAKQSGFKLYGHLAAALLGLFILFSVPFSILFNTPKYFGFISQAISNVQLKDSEMLRDARFINDFSETGEKVFILASPYQGVYYTQSQTQPVLETASIADIVFPKDLQMVTDFLRANRNIKVFVKLPLENYDKFDPQIKTIILEHYKEQAKTGDGMALYLAE